MMPFMLLIWTLRPAAQALRSEPHGVWRRNRSVLMLLKALFLLFLVVIVGALLAGITSKR
jgi:hypothetical protein